MGHRTDWLALAGTSRVKSYFRKSASGKTVQVDAYTRSVDKMSFQELQAEFKRLQGSTKPSDVNRRTAVVSRLRTSHNHEPGESFDADKSTAAGVAERKRISAENNARIDRERIAAGKPSQAENLERIKKSAAENRARIDRERTEAERIKAIRALGPYPTDSEINGVNARFGAETREAKREAAGPAAAAAIKKAGSIKGLNDLSATELRAIVTATKWNEPGDQWGERAQMLLRDRDPNVSKPSELDKQKQRWASIARTDFDTMRSIRKRLATKNAALLKRLNEGTLQDEDYALLLNEI